MNITINGDIYITNYGQPINDIVGDSEDTDLPFDFFTDDEEEYCNCCNDDCEDCEFYEGEDEDRSVDKIVDELTSIYADILTDSECLCPECTKDVLVQMIRDFVDLL